MKQKSLKIDTKTMKALKYFWLQKMKVKQSWEKLEPNQNASEFASKKVSTVSVCDAILSSLLMSKRKKQSLWKRTSADHQGTECFCKKWRSKREHATPANIRDINIEKKRNFITKSDLPVENADPNGHLKPWSETWLTLSETLRQLSSKTLRDKT